MVLTKEEFYEKLKGYTADRSDDDTLQFIEDITDSYNDLAVRVENNDTTWKEKYDELDKTWRKRYMDRFFAAKYGYFSTPNARVEEEDDEEKEDLEITIDDLKFKE